MSEAVLILQRARGAYTSEIRICDRQLEKAEKASEQARALDQRRLTLEHQLADIDYALEVLSQANLDLDYARPKTGPPPTDLREAAPSVAAGPPAETSDTVS